jgi:hypothetical protein
MGIYAYGFERFGEIQADVYHKELEDCFRLWLSNPTWAEDTMYQNDLFVSSSTQGMLSPIRFPFRIS